MPTCLSRAGGQRFAWRKLVDHKRCSGSRVQLELDPSRHFALQVVQETPLPMLVGVGTLPPRLPDTGCTPPQSWTELWLPIGRLLSRQPSPNETPHRPPESRLSQQTLGTWNHS